MGEERAILDESHYDVLLVGTDLTVTIAGAALAHAGLRALHVDPQEVYGGNWASLTLSELRRWVAAQPVAAHASLSFPSFGLTPAAGIELPPALQRLDRQFSLALTPTLLASRGSGIDTLVKSHVAQYSTFRLLELTALVSDSDPTVLRRVPCSKEDVFKDRSLSLIEKRKLMKFLQHVSQLASQSSGDATEIEQQLANGPVLDTSFDAYLRSQFGFSDNLIDALLYGIAMAPWAGTAASHFPLPARDGVWRVASHLASTGRYGNSAYLVGQYGGAGEMVQGYARSAAVKGTLFMLGCQVESVGRCSRLVQAEGAAEPNLKQAWEVQLSSVQGPVTADWIIGPPGLTRAPSVSSHPTSPNGTVARGIVLLDRPVDYAGMLAAGAASTSGPAASSEEPESAGPTKTYETALLVVPPASKGGAACQILVMGEGTFSCPKGTYLYYLSQYLPGSPSAGQTPEEVLRPYVDRLLHWAAPCHAEWKLPTTAASASTQIDHSAEHQAHQQHPAPATPAPLFESFYWQPSVAPAAESADTESSYVAVTFPPVPKKLEKTGFPYSMPELTDRASQVAEAVFWHIMGHEEVATLSGTAVGSAQADAMGQQLKARAQEKAQRRAQSWEGRDASEYAGRAGVLEGPPDELAALSKPDGINWDEVVEFFPQQQQQEL